MGLTNRDCLPLTYSKGSAALLSSVSPPPDVVLGALVRPAGVRGSSWNPRGGRSWVLYNWGPGPHFRSKRELLLSK